MQEPTNAQLPLAAFEATLEAALNSSTASIEEKRNEIMAAAGQLLENSALEMAEATINSITILLMTVYKNGSMGYSRHPLLNELCDILVKAGGHDQQADDTY